MKNPLMQLVETKAVLFLEENLKAKAAEIAAAKEKDGEKKGKTEKVIEYHVPVFAIGDTVDVHLRILEGSKERLQVFSGTVIARRGDGMREMFTVRRIVQGEGVERVFPVHSPRIAKVEVKKSGRVRRAKLYYLRKRVGKATRLRERKAKVTTQPVVAKA